MADSTKTVLLFLAAYCLTLVGMYAFETVKQSTPASSVVAVATAKPTDASVQKDLYLSGFTELLGGWSGRNQLEVQLTSAALSGYSAYLDIDDEVHCAFEGNGSVPSATLNNPSVPSDGVWWVGHCNGIRFAPGPTSVVRVAAYTRQRKNSDQAELYVVIGAMQYGPFWRSYDSYEQADR